MFEPYHSSVARAVTDDRLREAAAARQRATWTRRPGLLHRLRRTLVAWLERHTSRRPQVRAVRHSYEVAHQEAGKRDRSVTMEALDG